MRIKILILSLILILTISITCFAVDESGNVVTSVFEVNTDYFYFLNLNSGASAVPDLNVYFDSNEFNFNRVGYSPYFEFVGINRIYSVFHSLPSFDVSEYKYFSFEFNLAVMSPNVLIDGSSLNFIDVEGNYYNLGSLLDDDYGITLNYNGVDITGVNSYFFGEVSDLSFYSSSGQIQGYVDVRVTGTQNFNVFTSPLIIKLYKNYQDLIADVNNNVQQIVNQNDVIINNLGDVNDKLDEFINADIDESKKEQFEDEISKDIEDMESIIDLEESVGNNANDKLNVSIDYDTSYSNQALKDVLDNNIFSNFFNYLFDYPFVVIAFTLLPFLWLSYILLYRG